VGVAAEVHVCRRIAQETGGSYGIALNETHLAGKETGGSYGIALNETHLAGKEIGGSYGIALNETHLAGIRKLEAAMASH
jgi:hypothetical protein